MTTPQSTICRRALLGGVTTGFVAAVAGCSSTGDSADPSDSDEHRGPIQSIDVDHTQLIIELDREGADHLNVIDPSGELFARRTIETGATRTTVEIGTEYTPGEYEIIALADDDTVGTAMITLEPDLELTDLRLGRDHPEQMYEGASESAITSEAILSVTNSGISPTAVTALRFRGDVPLPTHDSYDETGDSGIYDPEDDFGSNADKIIVPAETTVLVYSDTGPFSLQATERKCESVGGGGEFTVELSTSHGTKPLAVDYEIDYLDSNSDNCQIKMEASL